MQLPDPIEKFLHPKMTQLLKSINATIFRPYRFRMIVERLLPYLSNIDSLLDVGTSEGEIANSLGKQLNVKVIGVDTIIQPQNLIPIIRFDGRHLPFADNSFDCVTLVDVVHHASDQHQLVGEVSRVSRKMVIIKDHWYANDFDQFLLVVFDWFGNYPYHISLPYSYLSLDQWHQLFAACTLRITDKEEFRFSKIDVLKQVIFVLKKQQ